MIDGTKNYQVVSNRDYHPDWFVLHNHTLLENYLNSVKPEVVYFPFWSHKVPKHIIDKYICLGFHTSEFSSGSPIQNLIRMGHKQSFVKCFRMTEEMDMGKVLTSRTVDLHGTLDEILIRMSKLIMEMINGLQENPRQSYEPQG